MKNTTGVMILLGVIWTIIYISLLPSASNGYGYTGYYGYHRGPSFWYFGGASTYHNRNLRSNSSGTSFRGGGPGSGK